MDAPADPIAALEAGTREPTSALYFTPVRVRGRCDGWTEQRQRRFVAAIALTGRIDRAAALVGMSVQTASRLRRRPDGDSFANACVAACTFAKQFRRTRVAAKGSEGSMFFRPGGPENSENIEPLGRSL